MRRFRVEPSVKAFAAIVFSAMILGGAHIQAQTWQVLPFPSDSDWPGPNYGQPAVIAGNTITLDGQPVRTQNIYSGALTINFDTVLNAKTENDGFVLLCLIPTGIATNLSPVPGTWFDWEYSKTSGDPGTLVMQQATTASRTEVWSAPFTLTGGVTNHVAMSVASGGQLGLAVNGTPYSLPASANVPFSQYQIELNSWQPGNTWQVMNFTAVPVPEPGTMVLVGMGLLVVIGRGKRMRRGC